MTMDFSEVARPAVALVRWVLEEFDREESGLGPAYDLKDSMAGLVAEVGPGVVLGLAGLAAMTLRSFARTLGIEPENLLTVIATEFIEGNRG